MDKIKIITDTASDINLKKAKELNIELIPMRINADKKSYLEEYDITKKKFWKLLEESEDIPKTSQITPEAFLVSYKKHFEDGYNRFIVVTINGQGSGTYNNACLAKQMFFEDYPDEDVTINVIDSGCYSLMYGQAVINGAMMAKEGKGVDEITEYIENRVKNVKAYAYLSTLKFAKKSGRISVLAATIGDTLGLKPIIEISGGKVETVAKTRGEKMAVSKIIEMVKEDAKDIRKDEIIILHGSNEKSSIEKFTNDCNKKLLPGSVVTGEAGCCIATNTGPEVIAIIYQSK